MCLITAREQLTRSKWFVLCYCRSNPHLQVVIKQATNADIIHLKLASSHVKVLNICLLHQLRASTETSRGGEDLAKGNKGEDRWVRPCALYVGP
ncbi:unnamed protein product [Fusarium graminearum]|nr:unnamed protein product [Fusarium graminearum]CAG1984320.1 unnamed protein product [Fusarium graminearum]CAG1988800.1 unnamed protein product [Fusarium graminearum]VTO81612.1 unnamed protein product [Fusarium graminearum]